MSSLSLHLAPDTSLAAGGKRDRSGFTLVELMVACAVMAVMLILISITIGQVGKGVKTSSEKVDAFQSARAGMDSVSRAVSVASLNPYWDYYNSSYQPRTNDASSTNFIPAFYGRQSDLHFCATNLSSGVLTTLSGLTPVTHGLFFQAPLGYSTNTTITNPPGSLNGCGFFVAFGNDPTKPGISGLGDRPRFRLYQWLQSTESLREVSASGRIDPGWITPTNGVSPLAENIIAFVVRVPSINATNATNYFWDSRTTWSGGSQPSQMHQLPPLLDVTMVAIDEAAANRLIAPSVSGLPAAITALGLPGDYTSRFSNESQYDADLQTVENALVARKIPYRVFTTSIPLRGSRWSP